MKDFLKSHLESISAVLTIAVFIVDKIFSSEQSAVAALCVYSVCVTVFMVSLYRLFSKSMKERCKNGFSRMATTCVFRTEDGVNAEFELRRFIQCKKAFMSSIKHDFKWEGDGSPDISSNGVRLNACVNADSNDFDYVVVPIGKNLYYNECAVVPISFKSSYADVKTEYFFKAVEYVGTIDFKIMLGHKHEAPEAVLYRKKFGSVLDNPYKQIGKVNFNKTFRMYEISFTPEVGYIYKIEWEK